MVNLPTIHPSLIQIRGMANMDLLREWLPPTRQNWELVVWTWQFFPAVTVLQWLTDWYPQGKTSYQSPLNIPGKYAWFLMEAPGFVITNILMFTLPSRLGIAKLPLSNWVMAGLYTTHYLYRAVLSPLYLNPSMSPIHVLVFIFASIWQASYGIAFGGYLGGYGPTTTEAWTGRTVTAGLGLTLWAAGFAGNIYHDDELREIRRRAQRQKQAKGKHADGKSVGRVYEIPKAGLYRYVLYPHYFCEWLEWAGFLMFAGFGCIPARTFLINEIATMLPRSLAGRRWYIEQFGKKKIGDKKAAIPGLI